MKHLRNEQGLTIAELLAAFTIGTFVTLMVVGFMVFVQKQYHSQTEGSQQLTDITIVVKVITKAVRNYDHIKTPTDGEITFSDDDGEDKKPDLTFELVGDVIQRNRSDYMYDIEVFKVSKTGDPDNSEDERVQLEIENKKGKRLETEMYIR